MLSGTLLHLLCGVLMCTRGHQKTGLPWRVILAKHVENSLGTSRCGATLST